MDCFQHQYITIQQNRKCFFHTQEWMQRFLTDNLDPIHEIQVGRRSIPVTGFIVRAVRDDCANPKGNDMGSIDFSWNRYWSPEDKQKLEHSLEQIRQLLITAQFVEDYKHDQARLEQLGFWQRSQKNALQKKLRDNWDQFNTEQSKLGQSNLLELQQDAQALEGLLQKVTKRVHGAVQDAQKVNRFQTMNDFLTKLKQWLYPGSVCRYTMEISFVLSEPIMIQELQGQVPQVLSGLVPPGLLHLGVPDHYNYYNQENPEANCQNHVCIHRNGATILTITFRDTFQPTDNASESHTSEVELPTKAPLEDNTPLGAEMAQDVPVDQGAVMAKDPTVAAKPLIPIQIENLFESGVLDGWIYTRERPPFES